MYVCVPQYVSIKFPAIPRFGSSRRDFKLPAISMTASEVTNHIPPAPIFLPQGPWKQVTFSTTLFLVYIHIYPCNYVFFFDKFLNFIDTLTVIESVDSRRSYSCRRIQSCRFVRRSSCQRWQAWSRTCHLWRRCHFCWWVACVWFMLLSNGILSKLILYIF